MFGLSRLALAGIVLAIIAALLIVGYFSDPFGWRKNLKARVVAAEQQTELAEQTTSVVERVVRSEITIRTQAERSVDVVQSAPGADAPLDPDVRARVCAAVAGLRNGAEACDDQPAPATS